jgi:hypothetical protein
MVFRREDYTDYLEGRTEIQRLEEFGPWIVYAFSPSTDLERPMTVPPADDW